MVSSGVREGIETLSKMSAFAPYGERMLAQLSAGLDNAASSH